MKKLNIKALAGIAVGTSLFVGSAFASDTDAANVESVIDADKSNLHASLIENANELLSTTENGSISDTEDFGLDEALEILDLFIIN